MSDFLAHLAERTLVPDAAVRPRLLSRYEQASTPLIDFEAPAQTIEMGNWNADQLAAPQPRMINPAHSDLLSERPSAPVQPDRGVPGPHPTVRSDDGIVGTQKAPETHPDSDETNEPTRMNVARRGRNRREPEGKANTSPAPVVKLVSLQAHPAAVSRGSVQGSRNAQNETHHDQEDSVMGTAPASITIRIGRVEVRGASPRHAPPAHRSSSSQSNSVQRASLDEYLARRAQGGKS